MRTDEIRVATKGAKWVAYLVPLMVVLLENEEVDVSATLMVVTLEKMRVVTKAASRVENWEYWSVEETVDQRAAWKEKVLVEKKVEKLVEKKVSLLVAMMVKKKV